MQAGLEPKSKEITIKKLGRTYEIEFEEGKSILWLEKEEMIVLRDKINDVLIEKDIKLDMLREKQDYIDEVKRAGGKVE